MRAGAQDRAHGFAIFDERCPLATIWSRRLVPAEQSRLRDADRRNRREKAETAGKAEATRVSQALAVDEQQIRACPQALQRG